MAEPDTKTLGPNTTVYDLVLKALKEQGFDGLYNEAGQCACLLDDLTPAECLEQDCIAGWKWDDREMALANELVWEADWNWIVANIKQPQ